MKLSKIADEARVEREGEWLDWKQGVRLCTRRLGNPDYQEELLSLTRELRDPTTGEVPEEHQDRIVELAIVRTCFLAIEGIENEDGTPLVYTPDVGEAWLREKQKYGELLNDWRTGATVMAQRFAKALETTGKKSGSTLDGNSNGATSKRRSRRGQEGDSSPRLSESSPTSIPSRAS